MKHGSLIRWALLAGLFLGTTLGAFAQAVVSSYSPPATTVGALPGANLALTTNLTGMPLDFVAGSPRAVWWFGASSTPVSLSSYTGTQAVVLVPPALRSVAGAYRAQVCATLTGGGPPVEVCTVVGSSATFTVNPPPSFTIAPALPNAVQNTNYSVQLSVTGGTPGDPGNPYNWSVEPGSTIPPGLFLNEKDGTLSGVPSTVGTFTFTIRATDQAGVSTLRTFTLVVRPPLQITTTTIPNPTRGVLYTANVVAVGGSGTFNWSLVESSLPAGLNLIPNGDNAVITGTPTVVGNFSFVVGVMDGYDNFDSQSFTVNISDILEITTASSLPDGAVAADYYRRINRSGGRSPFTWNISAGALPPGLNLVDEDGSSYRVIQGIPTTAGTFNFRIRVVDVDGREAERDFTLTIRPELVITSTSPLPPATQGVNYSFGFAAAGGFPSYFWGVGQNPLPPGLSLNESTGVLSGTPTTPGVYQFTIVLSDASERTISEIFELDVAPPLEITTTSPLLDAVANRAYGQTIQATGGREPYTWSVVPGSTLPPGLSLNAQTGAISGTPTTPGEYSFSIRVTDVADRNATRVFALTVRPPLAISTLSPLPVGTVGTAYSVTFTGTGGVPPYFWEGPEAPLPPGLSLNGETGLLSGTPTTAGTYEFEIGLWDARENFVSRLFTLVIAPPLEITTTSPLPDAVAEAPYEQTFAATGGQPPYTWSVGPETSLPPGLALNAATGLLSGQPTTPGIYNFSIRVQDTGQRQVTRSFTLTVTEPLRIVTEANLPPGTEGVAYTQQLVASGGRPPLVWSTVGGVPVAPGLTLSPTGLISGTPISAGTFTFPVQVRDSLQTTQTRTFTIVVRVPLQILTTSPLPPATQGSPYTATLQAIGGIQPYTWMLAEGASLPPGLSLNAQTGVLSGTVTQAGTFTLPITVMDAVENTASRVFELQAGNLLSILTGSPLPPATQGEGYSVTIEAAGGDGSYSFSVVPGTSLPPGLALSGSGVLSGTPTQGGTFNFGIGVTDGRGAQEVRSFALTVVSALTITTASPLPPAVPGSPYTVTFAATGGVAPYVFGEQPGTSLPPGLTLNGGTGVLAGTPTQTGDFGFGIRVFDARGVQVSKTFQLRVTNELTITTASPLPPAERGVAYSQTIQAVGGSTPYAFSADAVTLPPGLSLAPNTGVLSGTPSVAGNFSFTVTVTDAQNAQASRIFSLSVSGALRFLTSSPLPGGSVGLPFSLNLQADGGLAPYRFAVASGVLPAGITLTEAGLLSGTPTGPFDGSIVLRVTDSGAVPASAEQAFVWRITAPVQIITSSLPGGLVGGAYSQTVQAQGGLPPYAFRISAGSLPAGLTISSTGLISGTPTTVGTANFTVEATDADGRIATRALSIAIAPVVVSGATVRPANPTPAPNTQVPVQVELTEPAAANLNGVLTLVFTPSTTPPADDPAVRFVSGARTVNFQIPAGTRSGLFGTDPNSPPIQTGTVAGEIRVTAALTRDGLNATPTPVPLAVIPVPSQAPVITDLSVTRSATGLNVVIRGFSTPRNMTSATLTFTARPGANTPGSLTQTVNLSTAFTTWYSSAASIPHGSRFQMTLPVTISGDPTEIVGVAVQLQNAVGSGNTVNATF